MVRNFWRVDILLIGNMTACWGIPWRKLFFRFLSAIRARNILGAAKSTSRIAERPEWPCFTYDLQTGCHVALTSHARESRRWSIDGECTFPTVHLHDCCSYTLVFIKMNDRGTNLITIEIDIATFFCITTASRIIVSHSFTIPCAAFHIDGWGVKNCWNFEKPFWWFLSLNHLVWVIRKWFGFESSCFFTWWKGNHRKRCFNLFFLSCSRNPVEMLEYKSDVDVRLSRNTRNCDACVSLI